MSGQLTGVLLAQVDTSPLFTLGTKHTDSIGNVYRYIKAASALSANLLYSIDNTWTSSTVLTTSLVAAGLSFWLGNAQVAIASGSYGWVQTAGSLKLTATAAQAANTKTLSTTTGGQVLASGGSVIPGLTPFVAVAGAGTGLYQCAIEMYIAN